MGLAVEIKVMRLESSPWGNCCGLLLYSPLSGFIGLRSSVSYLEKNRENLSASDIAHLSLLEAVLILESFVSHLPPLFCRIILAAQGNLLQNVLPHIFFFWFHPWFWSCRFYYVHAFLYLVCTTIPQVPIWFCGCLLFILSGITVLTKAHVQSPVMHISMPWFKESCGGLILAACQMPTNLLF